MTVNDWDIVEKMIEEWLFNGNAHSFKERQALIPLRNFIFNRTTKGTRLIARLSKAIKDELK